LLIQSSQSTKACSGRRIIYRINVGERAPADAAAAAVPTLGVVALGVVRTRARAQQQKSAPTLDRRPTQTMQLTRN